MTLFILMSSVFSVILLLPLMSQPISLGVMIMLSTFLFCLVGAIFISSWYAYILFLIYVGGLLVMFAYVAALSPNILFGGWRSPLLFFLFSSIIFYLVFSNGLQCSMKILLEEMEFAGFIFLKWSGVNLIGVELLNVLVSLAFILLINLVIVIKVCFSYGGSLRPFDF